MLYAKIENDQVLEFPIHEDQLRKNLSNIALPKIIHDMVLAGTGYVCIKPGDPDKFPKATLTQRVILDTITKTEKGWERVYKLELVPENDIKFRLQNKWDKIRAKRDQMMDSMEWRYTRYAREVRLGLTPKDDLSKMDNYMQYLADITKIEDPFQIELKEYNE